MINWFPGHMVAAMQKANEALADSDLVIEVLDARFPLASSNPAIESMRKPRQRPSLKVLNKADVADDAITLQWLHYFSNQPNTKAIAISCKKPGDSAKVLKAAQNIAPHRDSAFKPLRMLIMGVPNVGKSTLINSLLGKRKAKVGDEPAVTKLLHRYDLSPQISLTDTPGLMWPKIETASVGLVLAAGHNIGVKAYDEVEVAVYLIELLEQRYPGLLERRLALESTVRDEPSNKADCPADGYRLLEQLAIKRGFRQQNSELDLLRSANTILADFRQHRLGKVSLESPPG